MPFKVDDAFNGNETNEDIYNRAVKHLLRSVFEGGKATCFAYGQTGTILCLINPLSDIYILCRIWQDIHYDGKQPDESLCGNCKRRSVCFSC
jgi:Kinesin motor domain